jgi:hypothetical protein
VCHKDVTNSTGQTDPEGLSSSSAPPTSVLPSFDLDCQGWTLRFRSTNAIVWGMLTVASSILAGAEGTDGKGGIRRGQGETSEHRTASVRSSARQKYVLESALEVYKHALWHLSSSRGNGNGGYGGRAYVGFERVPTEDGGDASNHGHSHRDNAVLLTRMCCLGMSQCYTALAWTVHENAAAFCDDDTRARLVDLASLVKSGRVKPEVFCALVVANFPQSSAISKLNDVAELVGEGKVRQEVFEALIKVNLVKNDNDNDGGDTRGGDSSDNNWVKVDLGGHPSQHPPPYRNRNRKDHRNPKRGEQGHEDPRWWTPLPYCTVASILLCESNVHPRYAIEQLQTNDFLGQFQSEGTQSGTPSRTKSPSPSSNLMSTTTATWQHMGEAYNVLASGNALSVYLHAITVRYCERSLRHVPSSSHGSSSSHDHAHGNIQPDSNHNHHRNNSDDPDGCFVSMTSSDLYRSVSAGFALRHVSKHSIDMVVPILMSPILEWNSLEVLERVLASFGTAAAAAVAGTVVPSTENAPSLSPSPSPSPQRSSYWTQEEHANVLIAAADHIPMSYWLYCGGCPLKTMQHQQLRHHDEDAFISRHRKQYIEWVARMVVFRLRLIQAEKVNIEAEERTEQKQRMDDDGHLANMITRQEASIMLLTFQMDPNLLTRTPRRQHAVGKQVPCVLSLSLWQKRPSVLVETVQHIVLRIFRKDLMCHDANNSNSNHAGDVAFWATVVPAGGSASASTTPAFGMNVALIRRWNLSQVLLLFGSEGMALLRMILPALVLAADDGEQDRGGFDALKIPRSTGCYGSSQRPEVSTTIAADVEVAGSVARPSPSSSSSQEACSTVSAWLWLAPVLETVVMTIPLSRQQQTKVVLTSPYSSSFSIPVFLARLCFVSPPCLSCFSSNSSLSLSLSPPP